MGLQVFVLLLFTHLPKLPGPRSPTFMQLQNHLVSGLKRFIYSYKFLLFLLTSLTAQIGVISNI